MTILRREMFGLGALGLGALALEGCGAGPFSGAAAKMTADEVDRLLTEVDRVVDRLHALDADPKRFGIAASGDEVSAGRDRCIGLLTTLCFMGTYRDLSDEVRRDPRVEAHLEKTMPRIRATLGAARAHLGGMSDHEIAAIDQRLVDDPELAMRVMEHVDGYAKEIHVPLAQRTYLRLSTKEIAARFRYEGAIAATAKLGRTFDRVAGARLADLEVDRSAPPRAPATCEPTGGSAVRALLAADGPRPRGIAGESCLTDRDCAEPLGCRWGVCTDADLPASKRIVDAAGKVATVGLWLLIPPACALGVLVLLTSLFMVIVGGIVAAGGD